MAYGWGFRFSNPFTSLNWTRKPGTWLYNNRAMAQYTPAVREELLKGYYHELGLTETEVFKSAIDTYFQAQEKAFDDILEAHAANLTDAQKDALKAELRDMQAPIKKKATDFDQTIPGHTPAATHPSDILTFTNSTKADILKNLDNFKFDTLLANLNVQVNPAAAPRQPEAIRNFLTEAAPDDNTTSEYTKFSTILTHLREIVHLEAEPTPDPDPDRDARRAANDLRIQAIENDTKKLLEARFKHYKPALRADLEAKNPALSAAELDDLLEERAEEAINHKFNQQKDKLSAALAARRAGDPDNGVNANPLAELGSAPAELADLAQLEEGAYGQPGLDLDALKTELEEAQAKARTTLDEAFGKTVTAFHKAAQRERDLISWLAAVERGKRKALEQSIFSGDPGYDVMMTGTDQEKVKRLHKAIQTKDVQGIEQAGGLETQSGIPIAVGQDANGQLTFNIKFPAAWWHRGYYTDAKHNSKADLLFQAALVRGTGAETIVTNIQHSNETVAKQLAREAFEAAREIGYERKEITIKLNGAVIEEKDLFTESLDDVHHMGQQPPQLNVDKSEEFARLAKQAQAKVDGHPGRQEESQEAQKKMKNMLANGRAATPVAHTPSGPSAPII